MKWIALLVGVLALGACENSKPVEEMGYAEQQALAAEIVQRCAALGIPPGTPQMRQCTYTEAQKEVNTRRSNSQRRRDAFATMGAGMQQAGQAYTQAAQQSRPVTCTTSPAIGWGSATTTCR